MVAALFAYQANPFEGENMVTGSTLGRGQTIRNAGGFTLIELLIVVVIIGILAAIAIPKFANTKEKAVVAGMKSDLRNLVTAQEGFFSDNVTYATGFAATQTNAAASTGLSWRRWT